MKIKVTARIESSDPDDMIRAIGIFDLSLKVFKDARTPPFEYVEKRYPASNPGYSWVRREEKVIQVVARLRIAADLARLEVTQADGYVTATWEGEVADVPGYGSPRTAVHSTLMDALGEYSQEYLYQRPGCFKLFKLADRLQQVVTVTEV